MLKRIERAPQPGDDDHTFESWSDLRAHQSSAYNLDRLRSLPVIAVEVDGVLI